VIEECLESPCQPPRVATCRYHFLIVTDPAKHRQAFGLFYPAERTYWNIWGTRR
jgi:hypothetical protein